MGSIVLTQMLHTVPSMGIVEVPVDIWPTANVPTTILVFVRVALLHLQHQYQLPLQHFLRSVGLALEGAN